MKVMKKYKISPQYLQAKKNTGTWGVKNTTIVKYMPMHDKLIFFSNLQLSVIQVVLQYTDCN